MGEIGLAGEEGPEKNLRFEGCKGVKRAIGRTMVNRTMSVVWNVYSFQCRGYM